MEGVGEDIKEDEAHSKIKYRAKLLLFKENRRPAYYGTWRKKSKSITARRPFFQDAVRINNFINFQFTCFFRKNEAINPMTSHCTYLQILNYVYKASMERGKCAKNSILNQGQIKGIM